MAQPVSHEGSGVGEAFSRRMDVGFMSFSSQGDGLVPQLEVRQVKC